MDSLEEVQVRNSVEEDLRSDYQLSRKELSQGTSEVDVTNRMRPRVTFTRTSYHRIPKQI